MSLSYDVLTIISTFLSWDKVELKPKLELKVGEGAVACFFSPCGKFILTMERQTVKLWDATSGELIRVFKGSIAYANECCFLPDGKTVVGADGDGVLRLWNVELGTLSRTLVGHSLDDLGEDMPLGGECACVDVSPNGAHILSGSLNGMVKLWWNFATGIEMHEIETDGAECYCCSFSPNGAHILFGNGTFLQLYDLATRQLQRTLTGHACIVRACDFAPDGASILSGSEDGTLKLWCATTGGLLRTLYGHTKAVTSCAFSPTGLTIVSGSDDATLGLWAAATGQLQHTIYADSGRVQSCCFSSDGKSILSGHMGGSVKTWSHRIVS